MNESGFRHLLKSLRLQADYDDAVKALLESIDAYAKVRTQLEPPAEAWTAVVDAIENVNAARKVLTDALAPLAKPKAAACGHRHSPPKKLDETKTCPACKGEGNEPPPADLPDDPVERAMIDVLPIPCMTCGGSGTVPAVPPVGLLENEPLRMPKHLDTPVYMTCDRCNGDGVEPGTEGVNAEACSTCKGRGTAFGRKREPFIPEDTPTIQPLEREPFVVKCDESLNPPEDIAAGKVNAEITIDPDALIDTLPGVSGPHGPIELEADPAEVGAFLKATAPKGGDPAPCPECSGTGRGDDGDPETCEACEGTGQLTYKRHDPEAAHRGVVESFRKSDALAKTLDHVLGAGLEATADECPTCLGSGVEDVDGSIPIKCSTCDGSGQRKDASDGTQSP